MDREGAGVSEKAIGAIARTQSAALSRAPAQHVAALQIAVVVSVGAALVGGLLVYKDQPLYGFLAISVGFIGVIAVALRSLGAVTKPSVGAVAGKNLVKWSRVVLKLPIPVDQLNDARTQLKGILTGAQVKYKAVLNARKNPPDLIDLESVRVNVFLPDTEHVHRGQVCLLRIPAELTFGMKSKEEREIQFRPDEGLTGRVFTIEKSFGALRQAEGTAWQRVDIGDQTMIADEEFRLTLEQVKAISKDLRWIVSFPLLVVVNNSPQTIGVLNVDGVNVPLTIEEMHSIFSALRDSVDQFAKSLGRLSKCRTTIAVEDLK